MMHVYIACLLINVISLNVLIFLVMCDLQEYSKITQRIVSSLSDSYTLNENAIEDNIAYIVKNKEWFAEAIQLFWSQSSILDYGKRLADTRNLKYYGDSHIFYVTQAALEKIWEQEGISKR